MSSHALPAFSKKNHFRQDGNPCVTVEICFSDFSQHLRGRKTEVAPYSVKSIKLADPDCFDNDYPYFEWRAAGKLGIPDDAPLAVRFMSDTATLISHIVRHILQAKRRYKAIILTKYPFSYCNQQINMI